MQLQSSVSEMGWYGYYKPLLERYARRLVKEEETAARVVAIVLDFHITVFGAETSFNLRHRLKEALSLQCFFVMQCRIFHRPPISLSID